MGHYHDRKTGKPPTPRSQTLPSSPTHSSDFEFTVSLSPRKSSATNLCPADDLFYKGQLLPLHLSPRISMVRTLLLSSASSSSSSAATTARHSSDSHSSFSTDGCESSRPSSVTDDDLHLQTTKLFQSNISTNKKQHKYFSFSRFSSVFRKESKISPPKGRVDPDTVSVKRMSITAKEMIRKYLKKAKPLYDKLSQKTAPKTEESSHSFAGGNFKYPRRRSCVSSCPSSMRSSPNHSGILCRKGGTAGGIYSSSSSSMEELQSAIQGAIAHCKNSMSITQPN